MAVLVSFMGEKLGRFGSLARSPAGGNASFVETSDQRLVRLVETRTVDDLAYLIYEVVRGS
jgi:hypothetical protein